MMNVTVIEIRIYRGRVIAFLMKNDSEAFEKYIVARDYNAIEREWYGGGEYFSGLKEAVDFFYRLTSDGD